MCHVKKKVGGTFSTHSGSKRKTQEKMGNMKLLWTKCFAPPVIKESEKEEPAVHGDKESDIENL